MFLLIKGDANYLKINIGLKNGALYHLIAYYIIFVVLSFFQKTPFPNYKMI